MPSYFAPCILFQSFHDSQTDGGREVKVTWEVNVRQPTAPDRFSALLVPLFCITTPHSCKVMFSVNFFEVVAVGDGSPTFQAGIPTSGIIPVETSDQELRNTHFRVQMKCTMSF